MGRFTRGQALTEAALTLPLLLLFLLGAADLGRAFTVFASLANAAREGARYCALHPGDTIGTRARVSAELDGLVGVDTSVTACPNAARGQPVTILAQSTFTPFTPVIGAIVGGPIVIEAPASMVVW